MLCSNGGTVGIGTDGLRESGLIRADELPDLGSELVQDVSQATFVLATENGTFFVVHLQILCEHWFSGKDPSPATIPPVPDGGRCRLPH